MCQLLNMEINIEIPRVTATTNSTLNTLVKSMDQNDKGITDMSDISLSITKYLISGHIDLS